MEKGSLQYKDLKEFKFEDWDGKSFLAFHTDLTTEFVEYPPDGKPLRLAKFVIGYSTHNGNQFWQVEDGVLWQHVYKFEDNKHFFYKRLTYRQLSRWLATGKGEFLNTDTRYVSARPFYPESESDKEVPSNLLVRTWDSEEWMQPTTKVLEVMK